MSSSESVKQALIKQILLESNTANARQLIEVGSFPFLKHPGPKHG